jgi:hypothetical protein
MTLAVKEKPESALRVLNFLKASGWKMPQGIDRQRCVDKISTNLFLTATQQTSNVPKEPKFRYALLDFLSNVRSRVNCPSSKSTPTRVINLSSPS